MDTEQPNEVDLTPAGATRTVPGLGPVQFCTLSIGISSDLHERYFHRPTRVDYRAFVSTLIAEMVIDSWLSASDADRLSERARASLRLGIADAAGVLSEYRRLSGTMLSADERLFAVLLDTDRRLGERAITSAQAISDSAPNIARMLRTATLPRIDSRVQNLNNLLKFPVVDSTASLRRTQESIDAAERLAAGPTIDQIRRTADITARTISASQAQPLRHLMRSPAIDVIRKAQGDIGARSAVLDAVAQNQAALAELIAAPLAEMATQTQKAISSAVRPFVLDFARRNEEAIKRLVRSPTARVLEQTQKHLTDLVASPAIESVLDQARRFGAQAGRGLVRGVEEVARLFDENWAYLQGDPRHPKPVLFVIASLPGALGLPLYRSIKERHDEQLIGLLESVLTNPELVEEIKSALAGAPLLHPVARRQMFKALDSVRDGEYAEACPQLYTSLEAGFYAAAEAASVIDRRSRFLSAANTPKSKAHKVDDLFGHLPLGPRYRRFLRSWVFGDEGARFRHGRVSDLEECRRQALLLTMAVLGWLELFGDWDQYGFRRLLRNEASSRVTIAVSAAA